MSTYNDQIRQIEEDLRRTKKNKATEGHVGKLKAKIARLKRQQQDISFGTGGSGGAGYDLKKSGDSSVSLVGLPSVGKSTLLNSLCGKKISETGSYAFTTLDAIPGAMVHQGASLQIIDLPGIISGASKGKGRGKRVLGVARGSDLVLIVLDVFDLKHHLKLITNELNYVGIRLNAKAPNVLIEKTESGGILISTLKVLTKVTEDTIKTVVREYRIVNANVTIRSDVTIEEIIDVLEGNRVYIPAFMVINKIDLISESEKQAIKTEFPDAITISAESNLNIEALKDRIVDSLQLIRIYMRPQGGETDYSEPLIIRKGADIGEVCDKLHNEFRRQFRFARIWGKSSKHPGQKVSMNHELLDEDVLTIIRFLN